MQEERIIKNYAVGAYDCRRKVRGEFYHKLMV